MASKVKQDELLAAKPAISPFEVREWSTFDKKFKTQGSLVSTDGTTATIKKLDGKEIDVPKEKLIAADRIYLENAFESLQKLDEELKGWKPKYDAQKDEVNDYMKKIATTHPPSRMATPELLSIVEPIQSHFREKVAEAKEIKRQAELARQEAERHEQLAARQQADMDKALKAEQAVAAEKQEVETFKTMIADSLIVSGVRRDGDELIISVNNLWHMRNYQIRLQDAQALQQIWAQISSPENFDKAGIKIVDQRGNKVGGTTFLGGTWVDE